MLPGASGCQAGREASGPREQVRLSGERCDTLLPMTAAPKAMRLVLTALLPFALGYLLSFLFRSINAVSAPAFRADLGLDADTVGLLTSAYFLGFSLSQLPLGIALDRFGPRRCSAVLLVVAAIGSLVFGLAGDLAGLTLGRALIGFGVSVALMAAFKANAVMRTVLGTSNRHSAALMMAGVLLPSSAKAWATTGRHSVHGGGR